MRADMIASQAGELQSCPPERHIRPALGDIWATSGSRVRAKIWLVFILHIGLVLELKLPPAIADSVVPPARLRKL